MPAFRAEFIFVYGPPDVALRDTFYPTTTEGLEVQLGLTLCGGCCRARELLRKEMIPEAVPLVAAGKSG